VDISQHHIQTSSRGFTLSDPMYARDSYLKKYNSWSVKLTTHVHLVLWLRMCALPTFLLYASKVRCLGMEQIYFHFLLLRCPKGIYGVGTIKHIINP
jgi:hypothetical protein